MWHVQKYVEPTDLPTHCAVALHTNTGHFGTLQTRHPANSTTTPTPIMSAPYEHISITGWQKRENIAPLVSPSSKIVE